MEKAIYQYAEEHQVVVGICDVDRLTDDLPVLQKQPAPFVSADLEKRIAPALQLRGAKSVVVVGKSHAKRTQERDAAAAAGMVTQMAVGTDYHVTVRAVLRGMAERLKEKVDFRYRIFSDTGPVVERALAVKAGLGFYGKNHCVISPRLGSFFNIGWIVTDLPLRESAGCPMPACLGCDACVAHCPGGALDKEGRFAYQKCVSYLTQKPGDLSEEETSRLGAWVYGCDQCQMVCPYNNSIPSENVARAELFPSLKELSCITGESFDKRFGHTAAGWRGPDIMRRNARAALKNISSENAFIFK